MNQEVLIERFFQTLVNGDRLTAREIVKETEEAGVSTENLISGLFWPTLELIQKMYRADQITGMAHNFATRLLRSLADQAQKKLHFCERNGKRVFAICGPNEHNELAAIMAIDLIEAGGFEVTFAGGGLPADEIMARIGEDRPNILLIYSSAACDLPEIRRMIDMLHEHNVCPDIQIVAGGGVFNRADGLSEEIGADLFVPELEDIVCEMVENSCQRATADQRTVGRKRKNGSTANSAAA